MPFGSVGAAELRRNPTSQVAAISLSVLGAKNTNFSV